MYIKNMTTTVSVLHIAMELVNSLQNNLTALIYSLVNGLNKITTESIKLILDIEQFGEGLILPTRTVQKMSFFFLSSSTHPR